MNIIISQTQPQKPEVEELICQNHKREIVAVDLSEKGNFQYLCCICLVEKMNNSKVSTIEQTKERIQSLKTQRQENKTKQIQLRLDHFKIILDQIMEFKCSVENTLEKIYSQIKAQIFTIQKEKQSQLDNFQTQYNFQEEVRSLFEFLSIESQEDQLEFQQDSQFIDEIAKQFDLLFNGSAYFQTIDTFKDAKYKINEIYQNIQIEQMSLQNQNNYKTPSLNKLCPTHNKEIIMIDIDSENKKIEDRFVCVDCISDHPNCQYRTIEKINQQWNHTKKQQDRIFSEIQVKRQEKQKNLNQQIAIVRKNFNQQLNEISEKLITEFSLPIRKACEMNKFKQISLQQVCNDELLSNINQMILNDKKNLIQDSQIEYLKSKDALFQKEIESRLEHLKQHDQLDIQVTINIMQDIQNDNQIQGIVQLQQELQESTKANQGLLIFKQDLDELVNSSKYIYSQKSVLNESVKKFQDHLTKIKIFVSKIQQTQDNLPLTKLQKQTNDYKNKFENDFIQFIKFCEIEKIENNFQTLQKEYEKLQLERNQYLESIENDYKLKIITQNRIIEELEALIKNTESKLKMKVEEEQLLNEKLKLEITNNTNLQLQLNNLQAIHENEIKSLNDKITQSDININKIQNKLDSRIKTSIFLDIKPILLRDDFWIKIFYFLQEKSKKSIKSSTLIFQGTKNGLNGESFWKEVNNKDNLLMILQSKRDYIFGAYTPCKWVSNLYYVQDDTLSSFIFSQTHSQIYPLAYTKNAIYCNSNYGPTFGEGFDFYINGNFSDGYCKLGHSYQFDQYKNGTEDPHLFGQNKPEIKECEIYQIQFN
ncbi:unnamed protein product [Paramecium octaurelia]|uniref:TLDc domain-containing protein n=1 Tax=Paramecium octaurelia TaxID=43137 RepID=A0A8S1VPD7_PAROT|nr:unnamed protein product [Paramecium octaurelia]